MWQGKGRTTGWRGVVLVAITYVYFLIFAQFAFLGRLAELGIAGAHLKAVMGAMAAGGILLSLLAPRVRVCASPVARLRVGLGACALAAFASLAPMNAAAGVAVALAIGAGLGLLTVTLVTHLRMWTGERGALGKVGLGTGIGYLLCNVPQFFAAQPQVQTVCAALACCAGALVAARGAGLQIVPPAAATRRRALAFPYVVACFAALVWLDSAAFFIIQHTAVLKAGTWQGTAHLWANGVLHFGAALASAWLLSRRGLYLVLAAAFVVLAGACVLLLDPARTLPASLLYPVGVSLYSVALVAYPSLLSPAADEAARGRQAGWIYAIAGWAGSALGIGMGQNLGHLPPAFLAGAGAVVLLPLVAFVLQQRTREALVTLAVLAVAYGVHRLQKPQRNAAETAVERGRQVYISEGCIHCHSQYVRPGTADVLMWGPTESVDAVRQERPPLIGDRRQGPDLSEVGVRRSALWLKMHFYNPPQVSGRSIMPSYGFLFRDERGPDLVAYLESLQGPGEQAHITNEEHWLPSAESVQRASAAQGQQLYAKYCATCHDENGRTRVEWRASFKRLPPDLKTGPFFYLPPADMPQMRWERLAEIARFGIPGTDMPGHEYLSDREIASLSDWLLENIAQPASTESKLMHTGVER